MQKRWIPFTALLVMIVLLGGILVGSVTEAGQQTAMWLARLNTQTTIAVVNADVGVIDEHGERLNYSAVIIEALEDEFVQVSPALAEAGFFDGTFGAVITFPAHASQRILFFDHRHPERVQLEFMLNPNLSEEDYLEVYLRILNLQMSINSTLSQMHVASIFEHFHSAQDQVGEVFYNKQDNLQALDIIHLNPFTPSLNLEYIPEEPFLPEVYDPSNDIRSVEGFANSVANLYLGSFREASSTFSSMRRGLFRTADDISKSVEAWLEEVDGWVQEWEQYGGERRDIEELLLDFRNELIHYKEAAGEYHDELHVQVLRANLFFDALYRWYEDLVFNENYLIPFLEELELAIIDSNIHVSELRAWYDDLEEYRVELIDWVEISQWHDDLDDERTRVSNYHLANLPTLPVETDFTEVEEFEAALVAWHNAVNEILDDLIDALEDLVEALDFDLPDVFAKAPMVFDSSILLPIEPPNSVGGELSWDSATGLVTDLTLEPFGEETPLIPEFEHDEPPEEIAPASAKDFLVPLEEMRAELSRFYIDEFLTHDLSREVEGVFGNYSTFLEFLREGLAFHGEGNNMLLSMIYFDYTRYLSDLHRGIMEAERDEVTHLHALLELYAELHQETEANTLARLFDFEAMMPESRTEAGVHTDWVNYTIAPFEFIPPVLRADVSFHRFGASPTYELFIRFLWVAIPLLMMVFLVTLSSYFDFFKKIKKPSAPSKPSTPSKSSAPSKPSAPSKSSAPSKPSAQGESSAPSKPSAQGESSAQGKPMQKRWIPFTALLTLVIFLGGMLIGSISEAGQFSDLWGRPRTVNSAIAVVNSDDGVVGEDGNRLNYSAAIIEALEKEFVQVSPALAETGFFDGTFGAVITFPSCVSRRILSFNYANPEKVQLEFKINPYLSEEEYIEVYLKVLNLQMSINSTLAHTYVSSIFGQFHTAQNQIDGIVQNKEADREAKDIIATHQFFPSLDLEFVPDLPFEPPSYDSSGHFLAKGGFAASVAGRYRYSFQMASASYLSMREGLFERTEEIPDLTQDWLERLEGWSRQWEAYGGELGDLEELLLEFRLELIRYREGIEDYHTRLNAQVDLATTFHGALSDWHGYLVHNDQALGSVLSELETALDSSDGIKTDLEQWREYLYGYYAALNTFLYWNTNWYTNLVGDENNNTLGMQENLVSQITETINHRPVPSDFATDTDYLDAVNHWRNHMAESSGLLGNLNNVMNHLDTFINSTDITPLFDTEPEPFNPNGPWSLPISEGTRDQLDLDGYDYTGGILVHLFDGEATTPPEIDHLVQPRVNAPASVRGFLEPLNELEGQMERFVVDDFLTDALWQEAEGQIGSFGSYLDFIRGGLSLHADSNHSLLSILYFDYTNYLMRIRGEALAAERAEADHLGERLGLFYGIHDRTRQDTLERLTDFSVMMPGSRTDAGVNEALVRYTIAPFEFAPPALRGDVPMEFFRETSMYEDFIRYLWFGIPLLMAVLLVTLLSYLTPINRLRKRKGNEHVGTSTGSLSR